MLATFPEPTVACVSGVPGIFFTFDEFSFVASWLLVRHSFSGVFYVLEYGEGVCFYVPFSGEVGFVSCCLDYLGGEFCLFVEFV